MRFNKSCTDYQIRYVPVYQLKLLYPKVGRITYSNITRITTLEDTESNQCLRIMHKVSFAKQPAAFPLHLFWMKTCFLDFEFKAINTWTAVFVWTWPVCFKSAGRSIFHFQVSPCSRTVRRSEYCRYLSQWPLSLTAGYRDVNWQTLAVCGPSPSRCVLPNIHINVSHCVRAGSWFYESG